MHKFRRLSLTVIIGVVALGVLGASVQTDQWTADFAVDKQQLVSKGENPYFVLEPGYFLVLEGGNTQLTITVLSETRTVDGVETRVLEERETRDGSLLEVSRNYFAMSEQTNDVYYFGEDVDMYRGGRVVNHTGAWLSGVDGARFGLMMPGGVSLDARYYQEMAPGVAMDRARIVSTSETVSTPAGVFTNCLKVEETTPLEPRITEYKYYAPGIGMVQDGPLKLMQVGNANQPRD